MAMARGSSNWNLSFQDNTAYVSDIAKRDSGFRYYSKVGVTLHFSLIKSFNVKLLPFTTQNTEKFENPSMQWFWEDMSIPLRIKNDFERVLNTDRWPMFENNSLVGLGTVEQVDDEAVDSSYFSDVRELMDVLPEQLKMIALEFYPKSLAVIRRMLAFEHLVYCVHLFKDYEFTVIPEDLRDANYPAFFNLVSNRQTDVVCRVINLKMEVLSISLSEIQVEYLRRFGCGILRTETSEEEEDFFFSVLDDDEEDSEDESMCRVLSRDIPDDVSIHFGNSDSSDSDDFRDSALAEALSRM